ncbi:Nucleophosmin [Plecturocebus cupreus]
MEDSMDIDMSPLKPQNYLFGCELKANKDYHFKVGNDENEHQLSLRTCGSGPVHTSGQHLIAMEEVAESEDEEEEDVKLLSISGKWSGPEGGSKVPQKKVKLAAAAAAADDDDDDDEDDDNDFDDEETEEKVPVKKSICDTPAKNAQKSNQNGKDSKPSSTP